MVSANVGSDTKARSLTSETEDRQVIQTASSENKRILVLELKLAREIYLLLVYAQE